MELTHILVVTDLERARGFYVDVLGAEVYREYGGTSCVLQAFGTWLLLVTGGAPTADKPTVTFAPPRILDGVKSLSYGGNMLATRLAKEAGADEALLAKLGLELLLVVGTQFRTGQVVFFGHPVVFRVHRA